MVNPICQYCNKKATIKGKNQTLVANIATKRLRLKAIIVQFNNCFRLYHTMQRLERKIHTKSDFLVEPRVYKSLTIKMLKNLKEKGQN